MEKTLLWENESITAFQPQTVSVLNISQYDVLLFINRALTTNTRTMTNCVVMATTEYDDEYQETNSFYGAYTRVVKLDLANETVQFYAARSSSGVDNSLCLPYKIYGIS